MPHSQRRSQPGPSPLHQVLLTEEPLELEASHGLVRDPRFWRLFSKAVHLSDGEKLESGLQTASNTADAKEGDEWLAEQYKERRKCRIICGVITAAVILAILTVVLVAYYFLKIRN
ncbi:hypothetical protein OIDMADRAFT_26774 [Oidiodendron maius Zn]|uniref:Uncharacterized protein n=1 Tax=Oidiodendron maius (strain Zn) TaxID=913774 RepID=A0A0C3HPF7_OIDMZ|nr:hypothetical protein OIDMADRAFT_26774 [Oidiodendron maius Zn]